jgi:ribosomal protein S18 acetylase RimI-like enzyme
MNTILVRSYQKSDYLALKETLIEGDLFVDTWDDETTLEKRIDDKPDSIVVAYDNDTVIGCVCLVDDILPFIFRLAVKKNYRKKGVGKMLVDEAIHRLQQHGHKEIALFVDTKNEHLQSWYRKQGFKGEKSLICLWREIEPST